MNKANSYWDAPARKKYVRNGQYKCNVSQSKYVPHIGKNVKYTTTKLGQIVRLGIQ